MSATDAELVERVNAWHDHAAFGELVRRHQSSLRKFLRCLTRHDAATADDLAQETFLRAFRGLAAFRGDASFSTWLLGIAHNLWRNQRRRDGRFEPMPIEEQGVPSDLAASELRHDLTQALATLSSDERLALHLHYEQGLAHSEIARLLAWPVGTVKTHIARGKERLRPLLAAWAPKS